MLPSVRLINEQHVDLTNVDTNYNVPRSENTTNGPVKESAAQTCQDILEASILPALPSDKRMPGMAPRGEGKTTDAIQSTPSLLYEPIEDTFLKKMHPKRRHPNMTSQVLA